LTVIKHAGLFLEHPGNQIAISQVCVRELSQYFKFYRLAYSWTWIS
jgi:hypothetical protein